MSQQAPPPGFSAYEDGKHRRYSLLFGVNGGAFAIAKLFGDPNLAHLLGGLTLAHLAAGMILFSIVMVVDIFAFGENMRKRYVPDQFGPIGKAVLLMIGLLICAGWFFAGWGARATI